MPALYHLIADNAENAYTLIGVAQQASDTASLWEVAKPFMDTFDATQLKELQKKTQLITSDITDDNEFANAMLFAERKARALRNLEPEVAYRRLHGALSRRGFSGAIVTRVLAELGITRS